MWSLLFIAALAEPTAVVALGDVPIGSTDTATSDVPGGWVSVLGDCMEEWRPGTYRVIDRTVSGATVLSVQERVDEVRSLQPGVLVVSLGAAERSAGRDAARAFGPSLAATLDMLGPEPHPVVLVGVLVPDDTSQSDRYDRELRRVAETRGNTHYVDLTGVSLSRHLEPSDAASATAHSAARRSAQLHATVGTRVCAVVQRALVPSAPASALKTE